MSHLHQILLQPTDVLFFRDGRPMGGSLAGHTAAWPLPDVTNHALHAALHRAGLNGAHEHRRGRSGDYGDQRDRKFGSLVTTGPFPVAGAAQWYFPRPKDAQTGETVSVTLHPVRSLGPDGNDDSWACSSLPRPLVYAVANAQPPSKEGGGEPWISRRGSRRRSPGSSPSKEGGGEPWISRSAFESYLLGKEAESTSTNSAHYLNDSELADIEHQIGIAIDPATGTTGQGEAAGKIYSAHYLRLREGFRLGLLAEARDKAFQHPQHGDDLIKALLNGHPEQIVVGGQQRICSASRTDVTGALPLPQGLSKATQFRELPRGKYAVKWVLLTPAIWPEMKGEDIKEHPGGWLPNWICQQSGDVLLKAGNTSRNEREGREAWRERVRSMPAVGARLVAAIVPKPIPVTGWALPNGTDRTEGGAKSTHLAVPAGAVYYFEADSAEAAAALANALNWHGTDPSFQSIRNRRSTLLGEKGYGLGVCGTWDFYPGRKAS